MYFNIIIIIVSFIVATKVEETSVYEDIMSSFGLAEGIVVSSLHVL